MWFATFNGAVRFNGHRWDKYDTSNNALKNNTVKVITESSDGSIVVGTYGGIAFLREGKNSYLTTDEGLTDNRVLDLTFATDGTLWIITEKGINAYKDGEIKTFGAEQGIRYTVSGNLFFDSNGTLWVGTANGLFRKEKNQFVKIPIELGLQYNKVNSIDEDKDGTLVLGTSNGVLKFKEDHFENYGEKIGIQGNINDVAIMADGTMWIATQGGAYRVINNTVSLFTTDDGLSDNLIVTMYIDKEGLLWFGSNRGISKLAPSTFVYFNEADGLPNSTVTDVSSDANGRIWVATLSGFAVFSRDLKLEFTIKAEDFPTNPQFFGSVAKAPNDDMLLGTSGGLYKWDGRKLDLLNPYINALRIVPVKSGRVWIATRRGVWWIEPGDDYTIDRFPYDDAISSTWITGIVEDNEGRVWIGTVGDGLLIYDGNEFSRLENAGVLNTQDIWTVVSDSQGAIWIGTNGDGAFRYLDGVLTQITTEDGLGDNSTWQIQPDNNGNIWFGTNSGINRYDGEHFTLFTASDGLATNEGLNGASYMDSDGRLWFCSVVGVSMTSESLMTVRSNNMPLLIEHLTVGENTYNSPASLQLGPNDNSFSIHFTALYFLNERALKYRYRLEGAEENWSEPVRVHEVRYGKLPPGSYTFLVEATTDNGITWTENAASLPISIATPFHQTPLFISAMLALVGLIGFVAYRLQMIKVRKDREHLERMVSERTRELAEANESLRQTNDDLQRLNSDLHAFSSSVSHDLRAPLNRIWGYAQLLEDKITEEIDRESNRYLNRIIHDSRRMGELIQDLLKLSTARKAEITMDEVNLSNICKEVLSDLRSADIGRNVTLTMENDMIVQGDARLLRIVMENLIGNSWKFTAQKEKAAIRITSEFHDGVVQISVQDNGVGFDQDKVGKLFNYFGRLHEDRQYRGLGIGLVTVKRIVNRHGGKIWAEGIPGEGATFFFTLKRETAEDEDFSQEINNKYLIHAITK